MRVETFEVDRGRGRGALWGVGRVLGCLCLTGLSSVPLEHAVAQDRTPEEITVTGSRLRRDGMSTPTPVTMVSSDEIRAMAPTLLMDALDQMPQFRQSDVSHIGGPFSLSGGANSVNLRGIGSKRTLVLLNNRRMVPGQQAGTIDISIFPTALIDRVEVVTGGASAAYGSDAISGVTNFILDTDFEGIKGSVQTGATDRRDHDNRQVEFAAGTRIGERGHLIASVDYYEADLVQGLHSRDWAARGWGMLTDDARGSATGVPGMRFYAPDAHIRTQTAGGVIPSGPLAGTQFIDGVPVPVGTGDLVVGNFQSGGGIRDLSLDWNILRPSDQRRSAFMHYTHELGEDKQVYFQALRGVHTNNFGPGLLGMAPGWSMTIFADNPFVPPAIRERMQVLGLESFPYNRVWEQLAPDREIEDTTTAITLGFEGQITERWFLSAYYQYGKNNEVLDYAPNGLLIRTDRIYRALDSAVNPDTGRIECRANIAAFGALAAEEEFALRRMNSFGREVAPDPQSRLKCVPFDPFAAELPKDVVEYLTGQTLHDQDYRQDIFDIAVQTELGPNRAAGPISLGFGFAYRDESLYQDAHGGAEDPRRMQDLALFSSYLEPSDRIPIRGMPVFVRDRGPFYTGNPNSRGPLVGDLDVWEVFGETIVPLSDRLDLHGAWRYADYAVSGGVVAGKLGLDWQITPQLRFRGTASRDTRAGTMSERFDFQTGGFNVPQGGDPGLPPDHAPYIAALTQGGNPAVSPEESDTVTLGMVWQPSFAQGFNLSADLYEITIGNAIEQLGAQRILDFCYIQGVQSACDLLIRSNAGEPPYPLRTILNLYINIAETVTRGVDVEASYTRDVAWFRRDGSETFGVRLFANYLDEVGTYFADTAPLNEAGQIDYPEWLLNASFTYRNGPFSMNWQTRYRDETVRDKLWVESVHIQDNSVASRTYTNVNLSYDFDWAGNTSRLFFHVSNLFDKDPPLVPSAVSATGATKNYTNPLFETLGRTWNLGVRFQF